MKTILMDKANIRCFSISKTVDALIRKLGKLNMPGAEAESYRK